MVVWLILIQLVTFVVIILVLRLLFGTQLKSALNRLQILQQESMEKEEILNKEIERARTQSQNEIARSKEEARLIIEAAKKKSEKIQQEASERSDIQCQKALADAVEKAKRRESEILSQVEAKAVALADELIRQIFTAKSQEAFHHQLIDDLLEEMEKIDPVRLTSEAVSAEVLTPLPLSQEEGGRLSALLNSKINHPISLEIKIDESLVMGLVIRLGGLVVDGSFRNKLDKILTQIKQRKTAP